LEDIDELVECRLEMRLEREAGNMNIGIEEFRSRNYDYFKKHLPDDSFISWIALDEGNIAATSGLCFFCTPPAFSNPSGNTAYIMNIYTKPGYRNRGIASKLMGHIIQEARSKECSKITLHASDMGRPIYEKLGFRDVNGDMELYPGGTVA
jgi:ribosomal protein S18 acetylase RimI-like enzyme